eukprot:sb/3465604/
MTFKAFMDPTGAEIKEEFGDSAAAGSQSECDDGQWSRVIREIMSIKEDKLRYSQIKVVNVYGLGLRLHVTSRTDNGEAIAANIAQNQIRTMANYLKFKKNYKSGFGMNSFWIMLELTVEGQLSDTTCCFLDLVAKLFGQPILTSTIFLLERGDGQGDRKELKASVIKQIAQRMNCIDACVTVLVIKPLTRFTVTQGPTETNQETAVASIIKILNMVARQTYIDPNPFEPDAIIPSLNQELKNGEHSTSPEFLRKTFVTTPPCTVGGAISGRLLIFNVDGSGATNSPGDDRTILELSKKAFIDSELGCFQGRSWSLDLRPPTSRIQRRSSRGCRGRPTTFYEREKQILRSRRTFWQKFGALLRSGCSVACLHMRAAKKVDSLKRL